MPELDDPDAELTPNLIIRSLRDIAGHFFPRLATGPLDRPSQPSRTGADVQ